MDNAKIMIALIFSLLLIAGCTAPPTPPGTGPGTGPSIVGTGSFTLKQAQGKEDVENAFLKSALSGRYYGGGFDSPMRTGGIMIEESFGAPAPTAAGMADGAKQSTGPTDYSQTNVQVIGVDELDSVKLDSE